jgi:hypothetical protein
MANLPLALGFAAIALAAAVIMIFRSRRQANRWDGYIQAPEGYELPALLDEALAMPSPREEADVIYLADVRDADGGNREEPVAIVRDYGLHAHSSGKLSSDVSGVSYSFRTTIRRLDS